MGWGRAEEDEEEKRFRATRQSTGAHGEQWPVRGSHGWVATGFQRLGRQMFSFT